MTIERNFDVCNCSCHEVGGRHIVACCYWCSKCKERIRTFAWKRHKEQCNSTPGLGSILKGVVDNLLDGLETEA